MPIPWAWPSRPGAPHSPEERKNGATAFHPLGPVPLFQPGRIQAPLGARLLRQSNRKILALRAVWNLLHRHHDHACVVDEDIQLVDVQTQPVFTHTIPTSVYRGAGRPEAMYFMERMLDRAAQETGIDRIELRKKNLIKPDAFPYHTPTHLNYDSGDFAGL